MDANAFPGIIRRRLVQTGQSQHRAALDHGLPQDSIRSVLDGHVPGLDRAAAICRALDLELYIGPPRGDPPWGPLAVSAGFPELAEERLGFIAQDFEHLDNLQRAEVVERFRTAMVWVLDAPSHSGPLPTPVPGESRPESQTVSDIRLVRMLESLADEWGDLNEAGRRSMEIRFWHANPDLRERVAMDEPEEA